MRITFILPDVTPVINGGVMVVYEYANRLSRRGHIVTVVHPRNWMQMVGPIQWAKARLWPISVRMRYGGPVPWMQVDPQVRQLLVPDLRPQFIPDADAVVATFFRTAPYVHDLPASRGRKYYLIQHYETWAGSKEDVEATWRLPMHKIVISLWLRDIANDLGVLDQTTHIPNGIDLSGLSITQPIEARAARAAMLYHKNEMKGSTEGIEALKLVKKQIPEFGAALFGTSERGEEIPDWIEYTQLPSRDALRKLYNSAVVFLQASRTEGWGLTSTEAMACGCALVSTDNGGSRDFAIDCDTALVVPVQDVDAMAASVIRLLQDAPLRFAIAERGEQCARKFPWDRAVHAMEKALGGE
jgi:glycosyltransferase involved in cell wall biosynthesis